MTLNPTQLRQDLYNILDGVLATNHPVEIMRHGRLLRILAVNPPGAERLAALPRRPEVGRGDPEDLVHLDWAEEWRP